MSRNISILAIIVFVLITFAMANFYPLNGSAQTSQPTPDPAALEAAKTEYLAKICSGHGGVNCSIVNPDALVVCNDGTIDESAIIYGIPECHKALEDMANKESDFMDESGCYPPGEMGCFSEQSYQNLYKILDASKLAGSELGKNELTQCRQQISDYESKNRDYRQCLIEHSQPQFELSGKVGLPILKAVFCPIFYGDNASYNYDANLCLCDRGYFMSDGTCTEASSICQSKYGSGYFAKNGNCYNTPTNISIPTPVFVSNLKKSPSISPHVTVTPTTLPSSPVPIVAINSQPPQTQISIAQPQERSDEPTPNFVNRFFTAILSNIKNIIKLF